MHARVQEHDVDRQRDVEDEDGYKDDIGLPWP